MTHAWYKDRVPELWLESAGFLPPTWQWKPWIREERDPCIGESDPKRGQCVRSEWMLRSVNSHILILTK
ncbi:hypothetical protein K469DRAFT_152339 [Zopfia rhizophila CBS 207.26]|uniref:Uncharacterized protein n=1 Tax=Zopfia rhizophila CBS 207.26 TaxID=1314779 RepID=A0A6A6E5D6_9PEZI|nr:hypothetical protein K469DRAFT_152339 [Zopfia rhizophila CBS 207.26]